MIASAEADASSGKSARQVELGEPRRGHLEQGLEEAREGHFQRGAVSAPLVALSAFAAVVAMVRPPVSLDKADASAWGNADPRGLQDVIA